MNKLTLLLAGLCFIGGTAGAQTILSEDFETGNKGDAYTPIAVGSGWTVKNSYTGTNQKYNWHNYYSDPNGEYSSATITGECCAGVDAPFYADAKTDGAGPREEFLITPELNLNDTYQLEFKFKVSPVNHQDNNRYDLQVRVITDDNLAGAETIFSIQDEKMLRESGVMTFPIDNWNVYTAKIGLEDFKGEKVKLAFVYKIIKNQANVAWIDDVVVKKYEPATGPKPALSTNRYSFGNLYIGEKLYSDVITLTNAGKDGLTISSIDLPEGLGVTFNPEGIVLDTYKHIDFNLYYQASMTSPANGTVVFHTNGGDISLDFTAQKQLVPDGYTLELFDLYFPPAGWKSSGWSWTTTAMEGDHSVSCSGDYGVSTLTSPRLDLSEGGKVTFTYYNSHYDEELPEYDIELQVSEDGGNNWKTKWTSDYTNLNKIIEETVDLGTLSDNSYIRWMYPAVESDDNGAFPHSTFIMDRVILPKLYGSDGVPTAASKPTPANNAENVFPQNVQLSWAPGQFVKGYKLYVGTNAAADDLIDGLDIGNVLSYTIPRCDYSSLYRWKVVGYNDIGSCQTATTWKFTTQADASVSEYPYVEDFTAGELPQGWNNIPSQNYSRTWDINSIHKYTNDNVEYNVLFTTWLNKGDSNAVTTQEFQLPSDDSMQISFIWGDQHPSSLKVDPSGLVKKNNVEPNNGISETIFSILVDGEWIDLSKISENEDEDGKKFYINEKIDLTPYKGKRVQFRWSHNSFSNNDNGGSLTHVVLERVLGDKAAINLSTWDAGKVNFQKAKESGEILTLLNQGINSLTIKSATFSTDNFSTTLKAGDVIEPDNGKTFSIRFDALREKEMVEDDMTVEFESGYKITFPVSAEALANNTYYYSFEPNDLDYVWSEDFTMIDVDNKPGYSFSSYWVHYSADGQRCAFSVENDSKENGMYGMMQPVSGIHALVGSSPESSSADNWIIFKPLYATASSSFDFYARNWATANTVLPNPKHSVEVLVSTSGNTSTKDFETVMRAEEMPYLESGEWNHYDVDLSDYAGQQIYVAMRHFTTSASDLAFFDDFTFHNMLTSLAGVDQVSSIDADAAVEVYNANGLLVAKGNGMSTLDTLGKGFYIVRVSEKSAVRSLRIIK